MAWIATDKDGGIVIFTNKPIRDKTIEFWIQESGDFKVLSKEIERSLICRELTWSDEPVEIGEIKPDQPELKAVEVNERAEFWKACVIGATMPELTLQDIINFSDKMLEEYDQRFGVKIERV